MTLNVSSPWRTISASGPPWWSISATSTLPGWLPSRSTATQATIRFSAKYHTKRRLPRRRGRGRPSWTITPAATQATLSGPFIQNCNRSWRRYERRPIRTEHRNTEQPRRYRPYHYCTLRQRGGRKEYCGGEPAAQPLPAGVGVWDA